MQERLTKTKIKISDKFYEARWQLLESKNHEETSSFGHLNSHCTYKPTKTQNLNTVGIHTSTNILLLLSDLL